MGTKWRGLLAPVNLPTDDGRRFKAFDTRMLPLGMKWQREDQPQHDTSVVVGSLAVANIGTTAEAIEGGWISADLAKESKLPANAQGVWGEGELFDDVDSSVMPRLAEDVAEAKELLARRVVMVSVDPIPVGSIMLVEPGQDEPPTQERMDEMFEEWMETGVEPPLEVLFEQGLIAAATIVVTPAFSEVRPFELLAAEEPVEGEEPDAEAATQRAMALTAAVPARPSADLFADPGFTRYTEIHVVERPDGLLQVAGHYAPHGSCHLAFRDACVAPPTTQAGYVPFHRNVIELDTGELLGVGRITTGFGKVGSGCTHPDPCRGKDDHACEGMTLAEAIAHHDQQTPLAWVRAGEDEHGLYVVGVADDALAAEGRKLLEGRKFSGDWREHGAGLELVELLALAAGTPAFPAPRAHMRAGRQTSLIASYAPPIDQAAAGRSGSRRKLARSVADMVVADLRAAGLVVPAGRPDLDGIERAAVTAAAAEHTGAMIALVPSQADCERLAVEGGEPVDQLHLTLAYLGEADAIDAAARGAIITAAWDALEAMGPISADGFSVSVFNPGDENDRDTCVVVGVSGDDLAAAHTGVSEAVTSVFDVPDQHAPFAAHITLVYTDDLSVVEEVAEARVGPITFDRLRIAFAGEVTDIVLGDQAEPSEADQAASLLAETAAALAAVDTHARSLEAAALLRELEASDVRV